MPSGGNNYYSTHAGSQIDQAFEAIEPLSSNIDYDKGKIVITNKQGAVGANKGPLLQTSSYTVEQLVVKPSVATERVGNLLTINSDGSLAVSNVNPNSYITKITSPNASKIPLMKSDGTLSSSNYDPTAFMLLKGSSQQGHIALFNASGDIYCSEYTPGAVDPKAIEALETRMNAVDGAGGFEEYMLINTVMYTTTTGPDYNEGIQAFSAGVMAADKVYADNILVNGYTKWTSYDYDIIELNNASTHNLKLRSVLELEQRVAKLEAALAALMASK